jgi:hypothetical protein
MGNPAWQLRLTNPPCIQFSPFPRLAHFLSLLENRQQRFAVSGVDNPQN